MLSRAHLPPRRRPPEQRFAVLRFNGERGRGGRGRVPPLRLLGVPHRQIGVQRGRQRLHLGLARVGLVEVLQAHNTRTPEAQRGFYVASFELLVAL